MDSFRVAAWAFLALVGMVLTGCFESAKTIEITYDRPAKFEIPLKIKKLAVAQFTAKGSDDERWGTLVSDLLSSKLDELNRKTNRFLLVDRRRLGEIMAERDLQMAISDPSSATKVGKIANVDAMIYGNARVIIRDEHSVRTVVDPLSRSTREKSYVKRSCVVTVSFTLDDIQTSNVLVTETITREYDSEKDNEKGGALGGASRLIGIGGNKMESAEQAANECLRQCVEEFIGKILAHTERFIEKLEKGKSEFAKNGNALAEGKEYKEALAAYEKAIQANGDDNESLFNAGLMAEALGDMKTAEGYYDRAIGLKAKKNYIAARRRVRGEMEGQRS